MMADESNQATGLKPPRFGNVPPPLRSASHQNRPVVHTPGLLAKLRSFSNGRVLSSKLSRRDHESRGRGPSESSYGFAESYDSTRPLIAGSGRRQIDFSDVKPCERSSLNLQAPDGRIVIPGTDRGSDLLLSSVYDTSNLAPYVLVPRVSISTEVKWYQNGQAEV
jgi:hypothetical protein